LKTKLTKRNATDVDDKNLADRTRHWSLRRKTMKKCGARPQGPIDIDP
jgi:hypothetical protein